MGWATQCSHGMLNTLNRVAIVREHWAGFQGD